MHKILLMGNPNVGKSVIFSRLTGVNVIASNYPGTTVEFTRGRMKLGNEPVEIIDVPGTYDLDPTSPAEEVAVQMAKSAGSMGEGDVIINVVDATNLERNLNLTLQLLKDGKPVLLALNLWDETRHIGISIDVEKLQKILGVPVVPTCAITGEGIKELVSELPHAKANTLQYKEEKRWEKVGEIISQENVKIEETLSHYPEPAGWKPPFGLVAKRRLPANSVIRPQMIGPVRSPIIVKRNQSVLIKIDRLGLLVTAMGSAMQEARVGDFIRVKNIDSQRIIVAKVNEDGTVEPVF